MTDYQKEALYELLCDLVLCAATVVIPSVREPKEPNHGRNWQDIHRAQGLCVCAQSSLAEVAYNGVLKKERQIVHERIGQFWMSYFGTDLRKSMKTLAFHYKQGQSVFPCSLQHLEHA